MQTSPGGNTRRIALTLRKPRLAAYGGVRPTVVLDGIGHPAQWGTGTWLIDVESSTTLSVYLFNRLWRFGTADIRLEPDQAADLEYIAPLLPFLRGRLRKARSTPNPRSTDGDRGLSRT